MVLDNVTQILADLEIPHEVGEAKREDGASSPVAIFKHGTHSLVALLGKKHALIVYRIEVPQNAGDALRSLPPGKYAEVIQVLQREMLDLRGGYAIDFDQTAQPPRLAEIRVEQRVVVTDSSAVTAQRFSDAAQELVNVGMRAVGVLKRTVIGITPDGQGTSSSLPDAPNEMYL